MLSVFCIVFVLCMQLLGLVCPRALLFSCAYTPLTKLLALERNCKKW